ncbi:hypothetical protein AS026_13935 [Rhizobium altiplani]|uniref:Uncharacterized protein n=1 Tax=Rhizobium altiplani TaxID=1864509 RepID=A0A109JDU4_9HYPH|nr:hypothetical protein [Rhizobium altiplani]KWV47065.1 hypothetical protein AS026_13935 [Rhizobium altiplani]
MTEQLILTDEDIAEQREVRRKQLLTDLETAQDANVASLLIAQFASYVHPASAVGVPVSRERIRNRILYHGWMKSWFESQLKLNHEVAAGEPVQSSPKA